MILNACNGKYEFNITEVNGVFHNWLKEHDNKIRKENNEIITEFVDYLNNNVFALRHDMEIIEIAAKKFMEERNE